MLSEVSGRSGLKLVVVYCGRFVGPELQWLSGAALLLCRYVCLVSSISCLMKVLFDKLFWIADCNSFRRTDLPEPSDL